MTTLNSKKKKIGIYLLNKSVAIKTEDKAIDYRALSNINSQNNVSVNYFQAGSV